MSQGFRRIGADGTRVPKAHLPGHTGKRRFRDELAAKLALATIGRKDSPNRPKSERRAYHCTVCDGWHLTSQRRRRG